MFEWYIPVCGIVIIFMLWDLTGARKDEPEEPEELEKQRKHKKDSTRQECFEMRKLRGEGWKLKDIAEKYKTEVSVVGRICRFETHIY